MQVGPRFSRSDIPPSVSVAAMDTTAIKCTTGKQTPQGVYVFYKYKIYVFLSPAFISFFVVFDSISELLQTSRSIESHR